jgi:hypothetical protein
MAIRKIVQYSPFDAQIIDPDHFFASNEAIPGSDELEYRLSLNIILESYNFPDDSKLDVEVKAGENLFVQDLGTVGNWHQPKETFIFDVEPKSIQLRIRVTPEGSKHFIGYSKMRACFEGKQTALFLTRRKDLGEITWLFEYQTDDTPILFFNEKKFDELLQSASSEIHWQGQILPQCIYNGYLQIASKSFEYTSPEDAGTWQYNWWIKAEELCPILTSTIKEKNDNEDFKDWAYQLSKEFSRQNKYFSKFLQHRSANQESN